MNPTVKIPKTHKQTGIFLTGFGHVWEPVVALNPSYIKNSLPPPFEAFGDSLWRLQKCDINHDDECHEYTCKEAKNAHEKNRRFLKQFNVVMGITRNKKFAADLRALKKYEKEKEEESEESESESETESESESEFESASASSVVSDESESEKEKA